METSTATKARKATFLAFLTFFVLAALGGSSALASDQPLARLTELAGTVVVQSRGDWSVKPEKGLRLYSGDKVVTRTGTASVTFEDGAVVEIKANSNLLIEEQKQTGTITRNLRLLLGKIFFKTGAGSRIQTNLQTPTAVAGLRGTAGVLSIGVDGQAYITFSDGGARYTVGEFISGVAKDVPQELADLNPAQRAAFVAAAAADQAQKTAEAAKEGKVADPQAALAAAKAAEAAAREAKAAAETMANNPDPTVKAQAEAVAAQAAKAIETAKDAQKQAIDKGADPTALPPPPGAILQEEEIRFDVKPPEPLVTVVDISTTSIFGTTTTITLPPTTAPPPTTTVPGTGMSGTIDPLTLDFLDSGLISGNIDDITQVGALALGGQYSGEGIQSPASGGVAGAMTDGSTFDGFLGGVEGSWRGLLSSIYVRPDAGAGFLTGSLSGGALNGSLLATGPLTRSGVFGNVTIPPGETLSTLLANETTPANNAMNQIGIPLFYDLFINEIGQPDLGSYADNFYGGTKGITTDTGRILGIWNYLGSGGTYSSDFGAPLTWTGKYGYAGSFYMLGDVTLTDDLAGHVTLAGQLDVLTETYLGKLTLDHRGAYDP
ncbi:MAG: FecR domain-containing protein, partial [Deltaproteobacteria bacterium]|nr:FecR domain-containing protein [Deltaproteobacteria bacterium]